MVNPTTPIVLSSSSGTLTVTLDDKGVGGWCQVHLVESGESRALGAEMLKYVASSLVSFLRDAEARPQLRSVLGLSELHTSAYGEHVAGEVVLHLQDANGKMFAKLVLTPAERARWMQALSQYTGP